MLCDFPATELLAYRRILSMDADRTEDPVKLRAQMETVLLIDRLRFAHEDIAGCQCWAMAIDKAAKISLHELVSR